jgi:ADP-ribose pyrophosphatase
VAVGAIVTDEQGRVLFLRRQRDPGKGKLGIPGGFVDAGESVEDALKREVFEETNLCVQRMEFLGSFPNNYTYQGVTLPVTDIFFTCGVETLENIAAESSEVSSWHLCHPTNDILNEMAFESNRKAVERYLLQRDGRE